MNEWNRRCLKLIGVPTLAAIIYMLFVAKRLVWLPYEQQVMVLFALMGAIYFLIAGIDVGIELFYEYKTAED